MKEMPLTGAFLAHYKIETGALIANTYRWRDDGKLERFDYRGGGKFIWSIVPDGIVHEIKTNPEVEYEPR